MKCDGETEQVIGREGETATSLSRCLFNSELRVVGFAPRQFNRSTFSLAERAAQSVRFVMQMHFLKITSFILLFCLTTSCAAQSTLQTPTSKTETQPTQKTEMPNKLNVENIAAVMVSLEVDGKNSLWVLLAKDGSINRLGTGAEDNTENDMFIGITSPETFEKLRKQVEPDIFKYEGEYSGNNIVGKSCELQIAFKFTDNTEIGSTWKYGTKSSGPPQEIKRFVLASIEATESWLEEQKRVTKKKS